MESLIVGTEESYIPSESNIVFVVDGLDGKHIVYENGIIDVFNVDNTANQYENPAVYFMWLQEECLDKGIDLNDSQKLIVDFIIDGEENITDVMENNPAFN